MTIGRQNCMSLENKKIYKYVYSNQNHQIEPWAQGINKRRK